MGEEQAKAIRREQNERAKNSPEIAALIERMIAWRQDADEIHKTNAVLAPMMVHRIKQGNDTWEAFDARVQKQVATTKRCPAIAYNAQDMHERVWNLLKDASSPHERK